MFKKKPLFFNIAIFYRICLFIAVCAILTVTISTGRRPYRGEAQEGDIATKTVYAPFTFTVKGDLDEEATENLKKETAKAVPDVYSLNEKNNSDILNQLEVFFGKIKDIKDGKGANKDQEINALAKTFPQVNKENLSSLLEEEDIDSLAEKSKKILKPYLERGIISAENKKLLLTSGKDRIYLKLPDKEEIIEVKSLADTEECRKNIEKNFKESVKPHPQAVIQFITSNIGENIFYDEAQTAQHIQKAKKALSPVYKKITIYKDEIIIAKNQRVTKDHILYLHELLTRLDEEQKQINKPFFLSGLSILSVILVLLGVIYLNLNRDKFTRDIKNLILIGLLSVFIILLSKTIVLSFVPSYLIPLASISMCLAILADYEIAAIVTIILSLFIGIITGNKLSTTIVSLVGGMVGIYGVKQVRRRSQILSAGLLVGIANFTCISAIGLLQNLSHNVFLKDSLWGIGNGIFSSFIVMGILPVLEYSFKITTNISLLELSDLNHPLLKEMVFSAPGTYHHSLIVGNLAEAAADVTGANALLARVGSYYHDIGKLTNAEYFTENKIESKDKHTKLQPKMSNLIITNHVKEGAELGRKYKLSPPIIEIIRQHHGTSLTFYFYQRALEEQDESNVNEEEFRYPGPKPQTKEAAIVLLADSAEAASRTIQEPTATKIEKIVHKIINNKFIDGQLDECNLTLKDLHKIADSFTRILVGIYHSRIDYPQQEQEEKAEEKPITDEPKEPPAGRDFT